MYLDKIIVLSRKDVIMCNNRPYGLSYYFFPDERFLIAQHKDTKSKKLVYFAGTVTECGVAYPLFVNRQRDAYVYTNPICTQCNDKI